MPFDQIIGLIIDETASIALAVFAMWMLNRTWEARLEDSKHYAETIAEQRRELLEALNRNTEAVTMLNLLAKPKQA